MESDPGVPQTQAVPAELAGPLPRRVRLTGTGIGTVIIAAALSLLGAIGSLHSHALMVLKTQQETLPHAGIETTSEITRVWFEGRTNVPTVRYNFEANGTNFAGEAEVPKRLLQSVEESKTLPVRYLPGKPAVNYPVAWAPPPGPGLGTLITFLILIAAVDVVGLLVLWRHAQLIAQGVPATAVVTKCSRLRNRGYRVRYEFRAGEGMVVRGGGWCGSKQEIGAKIWVVHFPQNPQRSRPYPLLALHVAVQ